MCAGMEVEDGPQTRRSCRYEVLNADRRPSLARSLQAPVMHGPHFLAQRLREVTAVSDDEHTILGDLEQLEKGSERLTIKVGYNN